MITLSQIVCRVRQQKNVENRSIISEDIDKSNVARFLAHAHFYMLVHYHTKKTSNLSYAHVTRDSIGAATCESNFGTSFKTHFFTLLHVVH